MSSVARPLLTNPPQSEAEVRLIDTTAYGSANISPGNAQASRKIPYKPRINTRERTTLLISLSAVALLLCLCLSVRQWWKRRARDRFCKKRHLSKLLNRNRPFHMDSLDEQEYHGETGRLQRVVLATMDCWRPRNWILLLMDERENWLRLIKEKPQLWADPVVDRRWLWNFPDGVSDTIRVVGVRGANPGVIPEEPEPGEDPDEEELANRYERQAEEEPGLFESLSEEELANMLATRAEVIRRVVPPKSPVTIAPERHDGQSTPSTLTSHEAVTTYHDQESLETFRAFNKRKKNSGRRPKNTSLPAPTHERLYSRIRRKARSRISAESLSSLGAVGIYGYQTAASRAAAFRGE
ncbi:hypothetical protein PV05_02960 [Exophiala xenobiotica]|uniref:Uncharacterized protein n=1 Tax=Exophiala xenobiotica TaxID=348802 RepID=A0A0D2FEE3_9EURO|nr:uncharacterized protein PV05_02960 [Exophiala xenobiotica]KIW58439.1 hypothetical protein PV05_02960 [Exophiala xenobiotica]